MGFLRREASETKWERISAELSSAFNSFYLISILIVLILFYPVAYNARNEMSYGDFLILIYLPPSLLYTRTFIDVLIPLAFVSYIESFDIVSQTKTVRHDSLLETISWPLSK